MNIFLPWRIPKDNIKLCAKKFWGKHMFLEITLVVHIGAEADLEPVSSFLCVLAPSA
jgi:hypothetical protein